MQAVSPRETPKPRALRCQLGVDCAAPVTCRVTFPDGASAPACQECALRMAQIAAFHQSSVRIKPT